jgi:hypothetical protein
MTNTWTLLKTYTFAHETGVAASLLESEGIPTSLVNEHSVQTISFYSNALGGVKLMVPEDQYQEALDILVLHGLMKAPINKKVAFPLENLTAKIPFLKLLSPQLRFITIVFILISIAASVLFLLFN